MDQTSLDPVKVKPQEPRWLRAIISDDEDPVYGALYESLLPLSARAASTSPVCLKCYSGTSLWEEDINAGNGERARFDVYGMTFGVGCLTCAQ